jgi:hypothetical protein
MVNRQQKIKSLVWIFGLAGITVLAALIIGVALMQSPAGSAASYAGAALVCSAVIGMVVVLVALPIVLNLEAARQAHLQHQHELMQSLGDRLQGFSVLMNLISEQQLISDRAKSVAFRDNDREAVRRAVQEEIGRGDWEAALGLAASMEESFGYKQEAERIREEVKAKREEVHRRQLAELLAPVDRYIQAEAWGQALQEAERIMAQHPDDPEVQRLPEEIENRRQMRKQQLRQSWDEAVHRHDVDGSIEILKRLDVYLTPAEADSMQEIARDVFKEKREALRARFALAVQEHNWAEAIRLGDEIINDFPNTRIAQEVREKMEALRKRAESPEEMTTA